MKNWSLKFDSSKCEDCKINGPVEVDPIASDNRSRSGVPSSPMVSKHFSVESISNRLSATWVRNIELSNFEFSRKQVKKHYRCKPLNKLVIIY